MLGLPKSTERTMPLAKSDFFERFGVKGRERFRMDAEISRMAIVAFVSPETIPAWPKGKGGFYVVALQLKARDASSATLSLIAEKIRQRLVFALEFGNETQLAVPWKRLVRGEWKAAEEQKILLRQDAEETWLGAIADIAGLKPGSEAEIEERFAERDRRERTLAEIDKLEKAYYKERQMRRKCELHDRIQELKRKIKQGGRK